ncbi:MAG: hypothetical protein ABL949_15505 [Fimbriimonadaceae bacterium]
MNRSSVLSSLVLAGLTLFTFAVLRNSSPETTVRLFHFAVAKSDLAAARRVCVKDSDAELSSLYSDLQQLYRDNVSVSLGRIDRSESDRVVAQFNYRGPNYIHTKFWVVDRVGGKWLVNPGATLAYPIDKF